MSTYMVFAFLLPRIQNRKHEGFFYLFLLKIQANTGLLSQTSVMPLANLACRLF